MPLRLEQPDPARNHDDVAERTGSGRLVIDRDKRRPRFRENLGNVHVVGLILGDTCNPHRVACEADPTVVMLGGEFRETVEEAIERYGDMSLLEALDLVPAVLEYTDHHPWVAEGLFRIFNTRSYVFFERLVRNVGKLPSDDGAIRRFAVSNIMTKFENGKLLPGGVSSTEAIKRVADASHVSERTVRKSIERLSHPHQKRSR